YGTSPQVEPYIYGIKPAIIGVILSLMITLGRKAVKSLELAILGVAALALALSGINEVIILFGIGAMGMAVYAIRKRPDKLTSFIPVLSIGILSANGNKTNWKIFWIFLKIGSILYGSGYVLFSFLNSELVKPGLLTRQALTDAIAVGQFTPGPVFSSATFIGWQMSGLSGAAVATAGIFLPSFLFVGLLNPLVYRLRKSKVLSAFLDAVNIAAIALILVVCLELGKSAVTGWRTIIIAIAGFAVTMFFKKLNTAFIIIGGAVLGYVFVLIQI
ncbi:MAG: chromate transporter, partial [Bacteroidetes bacterium]|nr:chromate transporter [Bacteroidota bacterium]